MRRLYRVLHIYSLGFHQVVADITSKAAAQQQLLPAVWKAFLQLWEEALQVRCFKMCNNYAIAYVQGQGPVVKFRRTRNDIVV